MTTVGLYAGSFDPITIGHLDILAKAVCTFDEVQIAIGVNYQKKGLFTIAERLSLIEHSIKEWENPILSQALSMGRLTIGQYQGISIIKHSTNIGATHIVRGLRQAGDFNDEFALAGAAGHLDTSVIFTHFIGKERFLHVSSSTARELASLSEDVSWLVTPTVAQALREKYQ